MTANWDRVALANFRGESFTFGEMATQIAKFHVFFEEIGLKKGDKVALMRQFLFRFLQIFILKA